MVANINTARNQTDSVKKVAENQKDSVKKVAENQKGAAEFDNFPDYISVSGFILQPDLNGTYDKVWATYSAWWNGPQAKKSYPVYKLRTAEYYLWWTNRTRHQECKWIFGLKDNIGTNLAMVYIHDEWMKPPNSVKPMNILEVNDECHLDKVVNGMIT